MLAADEERLLRHLQKSARTAIVSLLDAPQEGFEGDWCGGAYSPHDGCIYYVPIGANRVLKFNPANGTRELIGPELLEGEEKSIDYKWAGAVLGDDGKIYGMPCKAERVLRIDPTTQMVDMIGESYPGDFKWCSGARGNDGCIYGIPHDAEHVLRIDPRAGTTEFIGDSLGGGGHKWAGGVADPAGGSIYGIPNGAEHVLRIVIAEQKVEKIGDRSSKFGDKWHGGALGGDGCIYGVPRNAERVLRIDPETQEVGEIGPSLGAAGLKWDSAALGNDGRLYAVPLNADHVLCIDVTRQLVYEVGPSLATFGKHKFNGAVAAADGCVYALHQFGHGKLLRILPPTEMHSRVSLLDAPQEGFEGDWYGGAYSPHDGCIYYVPIGANRVLKFNPANGTRELIGPELLEGEEKSIDYKWAGAVLGDDGKIYGMPCKAERVLRIDPTTQMVDMIGESYPADFKWCSGARGNDGCIYGIPHDAEHVLRIDPRAGTTEFIGDSLGGGGLKWTGAVADPTGGSIYGIPNDAEHVLRIVIAEQKVKKIGESLGKGGSKWLNGALGVDGCIYGIPRNAERVLRIDPETQEVGEIGQSLGAGGWKWDSAARGNDGRLYAAPAKADHVLCIDVTRQLVYEVGPSLTALYGGDMNSGGNIKFNAGAVTAADGCVYALCRFHHGKVLRVAPPLFFLTEKAALPFGACLDSQQLLQRPILEHLSAVLVDASTDERHGVALDAVRSFITQCGATAASESFLRLVLNLVLEEDTQHWPLLIALATNGDWPWLPLLQADEAAGKLTDEMVACYLQVGDERPHKAQACELAQHGGGLNAIMKLLPTSLESSAVSRAAAALLDKVRLQADVEEFVIHKGCVEWVSDRLSKASKATSSASRSAALADVTELFAHLSLVMRGTQEEAPLRNVVPSASDATLDAAFNRWLLLLLQLDPKKLDQVADNRLVHMVINYKLTVPPALWSFFCNILAALVLLVSFACVSVSLVGRKDEPLEPMSLAFLCMITPCCMYQLQREARQARFSQENGLLQGYLTNIFNQLEVLTALIGLAVVGASTLGGGALRSSLHFRFFIAAVVLPVWINFIGFMRVIHPKLSAFVDTLLQTISDLRFFFVVLVAVLLMFCNSYLILLATPAEEAFTESDVDLVTAGSLSDAWVPSLITLWRIMLGDVDMTWLEGNGASILRSSRSYLTRSSNYFAQALFLLYTVLVVVILLNVAIAVISDSYERAMVGSQQTFHRNRLEQAAMFSVSKTDNKLALRFAEFLRPRLQPWLIVEVLSSEDGAADTKEEFPCRALEQEKRFRKLVTDQRAVLSKQLILIDEKLDAKVNGIEKKVADIGAKVVGIESKMDQIMELLSAMPAARSALAA